MKIGDKIYIVHHIFDAEPKIIGLLCVADVDKTHVYSTVGRRKFKRPTPDGELMPVPKEKKEAFSWYTYHAESEYIEKMLKPMHEKKEREALIEQIIEKAQTLPIEELRKMAN